MQGTSDALREIVTALREDTDVLAALYPDSTPPSAVNDRDRVQPGAIPEELDTPVRIVVNPAFGDGEANKSAVSQTIVVDMVVVASKTWYKDHQALAFLDIVDAVSNLAILAPVGGLSALGRGGASVSGGGGEGIQVEEEAGKRVFGASYRYRSYGSRY